MHLRNVTLILLVFHLIMLGWIAAWNAPAWDEFGHLAAGLYEWQSGHHFMYRVNPPLIRMVAAIPAALGEPNVIWENIVDHPYLRTEFQVGKDFLIANGPDGCWYFTAGRITCLPFTVLGGWMCFLWGRLLYGAASGFVACLMWCSSPLVLGWGSIFTPDAAATSLGLLAAFRFRAWLVTATWENVAWAGLTLGLCELTKTTWIVLFPLWPLIWLSWRWRDYKERFRVKTEVGQLGVILTIGVYVINAGYGFEKTCKMLGSYDFVSHSLTGLRDNHKTGNRFRGTILDRIPVPLPYNYVRGIDLQKVDFEQGKRSFLFGRWSERGWWYYYPVACCLKLPLGMLLLLAVAVARHSIPWARLKLTRDEMVLFVPAMVVFILVCSQTGFGRYIRYILPSLPAALILISKLWAFSWPRWTSRCYAGLLGWSVMSSLWCYPYCMNYFNELAGGPSSGHRFLLDANVDWGQDLIRLRSWAEAHPEAKPLFAISKSVIRPEDIGIDCLPPYRMPSTNGEEGKMQYEKIPKGWYAVSVHELHESHKNYRYLLKYTPVGRIGYSIWIYHITDEAEQ